MGDRRRKEKEKEFHHRLILCAILEFCTYTCLKSTESGEKSKSFHFGKRKKKQGRREGQKEEGKEGRKASLFSNWLHYMFHPSSLDATRVVLNFYKPHCASGPENGS